MFILDRVRDLFYRLQDRHGRKVVLVQTLYNKKILRRKMTPLEAAVEIGYGPNNGKTVKSAHVEFGRLRDWWGWSA